MPGSASRWVALYLQEDEAGQEILDALHAAKSARPELDIVVVVDWLRAQRGLIGAGKQPGNSAWYQAQTRDHTTEVPIYGVPVQTRELFGVLHLKGFVIDDCVIYSGASLNNVYLHKFDKYRFDRYHVLHNAALADSMQGLIRNELLASRAVRRLDVPELPTTRSLRSDIGDLRSRLKKAGYDTTAGSEPTFGLSVSPVMGLGKNNPLNRLICELIASSQQQLTICTPYFNMPLGGNPGTQPGPGARGEDRYHRWRQDRQRLLYPAEPAVQGDRGLALSLRDQPAAFRQASSAGDRQRATEPAPVA